jgi:hypothetical protein
VQEQQACWLVTLSYLLERDQCSANRRFSPSHFWSR